MRARGGLRAGGGLPLEDILPGMRAVLVHDELGTLDAADVGRTAYPENIAGVK